MCLGVYATGDDWKIVGRCRDLPKGCVPLSIYRVEETKGLIDGIGTVGLHRANGHNASIQDHVM